MVSDDTPSPESLFKFLGLTGEGLMRAWHIFTRHELWFSTPRAFNDPFDCAPAVDAVLTPTTLIDLAVRAADRQTAGWPDADRARERQKAIDAMTTNPISPGVAQTAAEIAVAGIRDEIAILSLSGAADDILMWGHYALSHTGIALEFETTGDRLFASAQPVRYSSARPVIDPLGDLADVMEKTLLHKAEQWRYEKEWRSFQIDGAGYHAFSAPALVAVIFGTYTNPAHEAIIRHAANVGGLRPRFKRAALDARHFKVTISDA